MINDRKRARILVVEDNRPIQRLFRHLLGSRFDIKLVDTVEGALEVAARERFDLFLLDINLGEPRTGVDLLGLLRRMPAYDATPAVACMAYAGEDCRERFLASGFNVYVDKPFSRPILMGAIEQALAGSHPWEEAA